MRVGTNPLLEAEADRMIRESLRGVTGHHAKRDVLTTWKQKDRRGREVYSPTGVAEATSRQGQFSRAANPARPNLNSNEIPGGGNFESMRNFIEEHRADE